MNNLLTFLCMLCFVFQLSGQYASGVTIPDESGSLTKSMDDQAYVLSTTLTSADLKEHLIVLASDEYEGRETGHPGIDKAANYITEYFQKLDLPRIGDDKSYHQDVSFTFTSWKQIEINSGDVTYRQLRDFIAFPQHSAHRPVFESDKIVFGGYGIDDEPYSDYRDRDLRNAVVMVYDSEPVDSDGISAITGTEELSKWSADWQEKSKAAAKYGIGVLLIISNDLKSIISQNRRLMVNTITELSDKSGYVPEGVNTFFISSTMAEELLGDKRDEVIAMRDAYRDGTGRMSPVVVEKELSFIQDLNRRVLSGKNMLGYIEGTDKKDEVIIVSAHYDHVGAKGSSVYNGADDNASGTSTVLELVETLATARKMGKGPRRSVLCVLLTGEEKGLLGSQYYVENPIFPIDKTVANVNIDMVGRRDKKYSDESYPYIYVIGSDRLSQDLHDINEEVNTEYSGLVLDYKFNDEQDPNRFYYRSDHYNFAQKGIPAIFFFNGVHDDYHRASDTWDKIDFDLMAQRAKLIFHTTWELANREDRIKLVDATSSD